MRLLLSLIGYTILSVLIFQCSVSKKNKTLAKEAHPAAEGRELFSTNCASCHALEEEGIGPRLGGITRVMTEKALFEFIYNPARVIESGDPRAQAQYGKYKLLMPKFDYLEPSAIRSIIAYIKRETETGNLKPLEVSAIVAETNKVRYAPPIEQSTLRIELEEYAQIPGSPGQTPKTRIATLRAHPAADGTLLVSDQYGLIYRIEKGKVATYLDIRPRLDNYVNVPGLGTGLGSFAFHPDYLTNGLMYITHTEIPGSGTADYSYPDSVKVRLQWVLSEWKANDPNAATFTGTRRELLRINVPGVVHGTQDIDFVPGLKKGNPDYGMLYIGTGDGGTTIGKHPELTHSLHSLLGTIIRIDPLGNTSPNGKYGIPADNPFLNSADPLVRKEIWAYGFRNPHRLAWWQSPEGPVLIEAEVGEGHVEELNVIQRGGDYGWNVREGDYVLNLKAMNQVTPVPLEDTAQYLRPFAQYDHDEGNAISGGYVYEGSIEALQNKYIFGDIIRGRLLYLDLGKGLTDSTIYELSIIQNGAPITMKELAPTPRIDLRITYDPYQKEMFLMTKGDGKIRKITKAYFDKK